MPEDNTNRAISVNKSGEGTIGPVVIANNVFYNHKWVTIYCPVTAFEGNEELIIRNNIFLNYSRCIAGAAFDEPFIRGDNIFYTDEPYVSVPDSGMKVDPLLVDYKNHDFHPQTASPVRNAGTNLSQYFATDRNGNPRPAEGAWDIGAYRYESVDVKSPMPSLLHPRFNSVLSNPWVPEADYGIIDLTGKRVDGSQAYSGTYLIREFITGSIRKVVIIR